MIKRAILVLPVEEISVVDSEISKSEVLYQVVDMVIYVIVILPVVDISVVGSGQ